MYLKSYSIKYCNEQGPSSARELTCYILVLYLFFCIYLGMYALSESHRSQGNQRLNQATQSAEAGQARKIAKASSIPEPSFSKLSWQLCPISSGQGQNSLPKANKIERRRRKVKSLVQGYTVHIRSGGSPRAEQVLTTGRDLPTPRHH